MPETTERQLRIGTNLSQRSFMKTSGSKLEKKRRWMERKCSTRVCLQKDC